MAWTKEKRKEMYQTNAAYRERVLMQNLTWRQNTVRSKQENDVYLKLTKKEKGIPSARELRQQWIKSYKLEKGCARCPEKDPVCLDFHHDNPADKKFEISKKIWKFSLQKLQEEIKKCTVICSNCHRKLHAAEEKVD